MPYVNRSPVFRIASDVAVPAGSLSRPAPQTQVATLADGRIVMVWSGDRFGAEVRFQFIDSDGLPLSSPINVGGSANGPASPVDVLALSNGGFMISSVAGIQRYDAAGTAIGGLLEGTGEMAAFGSGFVVSGGNQLRFYDAAGQLTSSNLAYTYQDPQVAAHQGADAASSRIVVASHIRETTQNDPYRNSSLFFQVFDGNGRAITNLAIAKSPGFHTDPDVAFLTDGSFVMAWSFAGGQLVRQHYSADGALIREFVSQAASGSPMVIPTAEGGYWISYSHGAGTVLQEFDSQDRSRANAVQYSFPNAQDVIFLPDGHLLLAGYQSYQILTSAVIATSVGDNANNVFNGTAGEDSYDGLTGNDTIYGLAGSDTLRGGDGNDFLYGGDGDDILIGGAGSDTINGGAGLDAIALDKATGNYFIERTADGFRIWDGGEFDTVTDVEFILGPDGKVYDLSQFENVSFNGLAYIAGYADLSRGLGANASAGYQHYIQSGKAEGRTIGFSAVSYLAANSDLAAAFGLDTNQAARHYIEHGRAEGRSLTGFQARDYGAANPDLARLIGNDVAALTLHYVQFGAREGRPLTGFDALEYAASNISLAKAYKTDIVALTNHYLDTGADAGLSINSFNPLLYAASHADLARGFGSNTNLAIRHYINSGIAEGRAESGFDSVGYLLSYSDLSGIGAGSALLHWLNNGAREGRIGDDLFGREQGAAHGFANGAVTASLESVRDHDWFEIGFVAGYDAVIRLSGVSSGGGTLTDGWLQLFSEAGVLVASNRGPAGTSDAEITFHPTATGRYFLVVAGETDQQTGTYRVTVNGVPAAAVTSASLPGEHDAFIVAPASETLALDPIDDWAQAVSVIDSVRPSANVSSYHPDSLFALFDGHTEADQSLWIKPHSDGWL